MAGWDQAVRMTLKRFVRFGLVGALGAAIQSAVFYLLFHVAGVADYLRIMGLPIPWSLSFAILAAMASNYVLDSKWAFSDAKG